MAQQQGRGSQPFMTTELVEHIIGHLSARDKARAAGTCKDFKNAVDFRWAKLERSLPVDGKGAF